MLPSSSYALGVNELDTYSDVQVLIVIQIELSQVSVDVQALNSAELHLASEDLARV